MESQALGFFASASWRRCGEPDLRDGCGLRSRVLGWSPLRNLTPREIAGIIVCPVPLRFVFEGRRRLQFALEWRLQACSVCNGSLGRRSSIVISQQWQMTAKLLRQGEVLPDRDVGKHFCQSFCELCKSSLCVKLCKSLCVCKASMCKSFSLQSFCGCVKALCSTK